MATRHGSQRLVLLLDEPTNHLDLPSIERLEEAVAGRPGAVVLLTHDDQPATAATTATWGLEGGELVSGGSGGPRHAATPSLEVAFQDGFGGGSNGLP